MREPINAVELGLAYRRFLLASAAQVPLLLVPLATEGFVYVETAAAVDRLAFAGLLASVVLAIYYGLRAVKELGSRRAWVWVSAMLLLLPCTTLPIGLPLTVAIHRACRANGIRAGLFGPRG